jgi:hypothetical protein
MYRRDRETEIRKELGSSHYLKDMHNNGHTDIQLTSRSVFIFGNDIGSGPSSSFISMSSSTFILMT